ncbi:MAG: fumarylacetoacetate hydrolase family protein [bacterium]|nr:fumarylacetoacetate hydrolase family protein [bacterium]
MKLVTFTYKGRTRLGEVDGDTIYTIAWADSMLSLLRRGIMPNRTWERFPMADVTLEAPLRPGKIFGIGLNYADHAAETGREAPPEPLVFAKQNSAVIGIHQAITWDTTITNQVDYEGELAVIIGKRAQRISEDQAMDHVFGFAAANDVSARDLQEGQWVRAKGIDTFCPLGPWLVTKDEVPDPHALAIKTVLNDQVMQDGNTRDLIFKIPTLVAYLSKFFTLEPGDMILTGTPAGVGMARSPQVFMKDGDTVSVTIDGLGTLTNPCKILSP